MQESFKNKHIRTLTSKWVLIPLKYLLEVRRILQQCCYQAKHFCPGKLVSGSYFKVSSEENQFHCNVIKIGFSIPNVIR